MNTVNGGSAEKMTVDQKLELLRTKMKERGMDAYMVEHFLRTQWIFNLCSVLM